MINTQNIKLHLRRSIRLAGYDYASEGGYFITIVTKGRVCLFGEVINGEMQINDFGKIVYEEWFRSKEIRQEIELDMDEFVVMPNHIHGIMQIINDQVVGATGRSPLQNPLVLHQNQSVHLLQVINPR